MFERFLYDRDRRPNKNKAVDAGQEEALLNQRSELRSQIEASGRHGEARQKPSPKLISQLLAQTEHSQADHSPQPLEKRHTGSNADQEEKDRKYAESLQESSQRRPVRATRQTLRYRSASPLAKPPIEKFSQVHGIKPEWTQPVVYPFVGKKRTTVVFSDLERLDEDEMLNDNLIEFYIKWLIEQHETPGRQVYFFGTHFYTALTTGGKRGFNYEAVHRWTTKEDIFSYDYVVIPVNES
jgi:Ulp1 family protease